MELIPPTNFDDVLVDAFKAMGIKEVYGKLAVDFIGGGRFASGLPNVGRVNFLKHIKKLNDAGIGFNYILNAPCLSSREFTRTGRRRIKKLLNWLDLNGVKKVTVAIPYLLQVIKDNYPDFKVCVSTYAQVDSYQKAKYWQDIGADEITLLDTSVNRNFKLLKAIRSKISAKLRLIANTGCLHHCHLLQSHALSASHGSQESYFHKPGFAVDYCVICCRYLRLLDPVNFIRSQWIRPEDIGIYEAEGIDGIKLIDRRCSAATIIAITKSYYERKHHGNLLDLLPAFHGKSPKNLTSILLKIKYCLHPYENNIFNILKLYKTIEGIDIYIDNIKLGGFLSGLKSRDCDYLDCSECGYCNKVAQEAVRYDKDYIDRMLKAYKGLINDIVKGEL
ncbi:MAG: U32 family peptidase [Candidatus Omnitrophica bacterium]|nr:U32 family peptidase [Candidatus Omnitrophota bacterium]